MEIGLNHYFERIGKALEQSPSADLAKTAEILLNARRNGNWVFTAGNGGSASSASHFVNDLVKGLSVQGKKRFKAIALCDSMPIVTAVGNDYDYSDIFAEQIKNYSTKGDILVLISGSGNSPNIIKAAQFGKSNGLTVLSFTGRDGGLLKNVSDICCIAASDMMEEIEDIHSVWCHSLITILRNAIACDK